MNILRNGLANAMAVIKKLPTVFRVADEEFATAGGRIARILGGSTTGADDYTEIYKTHVWVYAAINAIARNVSGVPFVFQTKSGRAAESHAFAELFERPNKWQGFGQLIESLTSWLHLNGEVMLVMRRGSFTEVPKEMAAVDSTMFEPVLSKTTGRLVGWTVDNDDGTKTPYNLYEVVFIKFWNPEDEWRGLSPISAAAAGITQDLIANRYNTEFFRNSGSPSGVIEIEQNLTDTEFERLVRQYEDRHGGAENSHKMLILEGGAKFKPTVFGPKDMEFLSQKKWNRDEVLAAYGIPKLEVGIIEEGANLAVIKVQSREFWLKNLIPKMKMIEWALWSQLFVGINSGRVWAEFDYSSIQALQDDFKEMVQTAKTLWEMGYPMNQINKRLNLGMPENSWQNTAFSPVNVAPISVDDNGTPIHPNFLTPAADPLEPSPTGPDTSPQKGPEPPKQIAPPATAQTAPPAKAYADLEKKLGTWLFKQRVKQLKAIEKGEHLSLDKGQESLKKYLGDRDISVDASDLQNLIHSEVTNILVLHQGDKERIINEVKGLYNKVSRALPRLAEALYKRHTSEM